MEPAEKISPKTWMRAAPVRQLMAALTADGQPARYVGGCVRDMLLDRDVRDVDVATALAPEEVIRRLAEAGVRTVATGIEHGTVTAILGERAGPFDHFEITTLRTDVTTDGRRATVAFIDDWATDAARRDFTINALFCDGDGTVYDPVGGLADLRQGKVRFVGDAAQRIREDVLRLLRFFRFQATYGTAPADADGLAACTELAPLLPTLSGERVAHELMRLLAAQDPAPVFSLMAGQGILLHVLPETGAIDRLAALTVIEDRTVGTDPLRRLAAMLIVDAGGAAGVAERLRLSKVQRLRLIAMAAGLPNVDAAMSQHERRALLYGVGERAFVDFVLLAWADRLARGAACNDEAWQMLLALPQHWSLPTLPVGGRDVQVLGVPDGPAIGEALQAVESWWIAGDFSGDRAACLARLQELVAPGS